jgi:acetyl-CoA carboxylase biotin carboxylase subunit
MITTLLIANRGEIACRIIRTCRCLGIRAVAVYSDADARALYVRLADEAVHIGPALARESYLNIDAILAAARRAEADAIHPGYGFLAENASFAQACVGAGLTFVGPSPAAMAALGDKRAARELAARAGVPVLPGYSGEDQSDDALRSAAERIGWPLMIKAAAGGGGVGMRLVERAADLIEALDQARRAARQAFGAGELLLERALVAPRHVEIQVFGDQQGNVVHLGERECSIQRRRQKVIEETPAPDLAPDLRAALGAAAVGLARAAGYTGAGTAEFLLDREGAYFFLEMNTRLQVEHAVTECTTGLDLVEWQIRVAEGQPLPLRQEQIIQRGHAIEARLYAEDPARGFLPATGEILHWRAPAGAGVRVDHGIASGEIISIHYDPLLAKIIAHGPDRATAIRRLARALERMTVLGVQTNQALLRALLGHPAFQAGTTDTEFLTRYGADWREPVGDLPTALIAATLAQWLQHPRPDGSRGYWRNNLSQPQIYRYAVPFRNESVEVRLTPSRKAEGFQVVVTTEPEVTAAVELNEIVYPAAANAPTASALLSQRERGLEAEGQPTNLDLTLTIDGHRQHAILAYDTEVCWVQTRHGVVRLRAQPRLPIPGSPADAAGSLRAPMPGKVLAVLVQPGQRVAKGDALLKLEAMKMEHTIRTAADGVVETIYFAPGDTVDADALLVKIAEIRE